MICKRRSQIDTKYGSRQAALIIGVAVLVLVLVATLISWLYLLAWDGRVACPISPWAALYLWFCLAVSVMGTILVCLRRSRITADMSRKGGKSSKSQ